MRLQFSAETREIAIATAKLKAAKWFGVEPTCVSVSFLNPVSYDQRSSTVDRYLSVFVEATEKHTYDTPTYGFATCRYCKKRKNS